MTPEIKKKWDALKYRMERESYLLILLELRFASLEHAITMSFGHREVALALGLSDRYVRLMKQIRDTTEGTIEDYALSMLEYVYEENGNDKRNFTHFRMFDTDALDRWWKNKCREEELDIREVDKETLICDFKHDFWRKFKVDIEITELEAKEIRDPEESDEDGFQQDAEQEPEDDDSKEMLQAFNKQLAEESLLTRMFISGDIDETLCRKYMNAEELSQEAFQRILQIHREESQEELVESMAHTQKLEHQMELIAKLVNGEDITRNRAFEIMNINNDFHDFVEFLKILEIWEDKLHE